MVDFSTLPSPAFVLDERLLDRNLALIDRVRCASGAEIIVALKACAMWSIFPELARHSDGATASSAAEARLVFEHFGMSAHTYAPVYTDASFAEILKYSSHITFNSVAQYERFGTQAREKGVSCGLRVNPEYSPVETDLYNPAMQGSRLGVTAGELAARSEGKLAKHSAGELVARYEGEPAALSAPATRSSDEPSALPEGIEGLHFHVLCESGPEHLEKALEAVERRFGAYLDRVKWLNCGGGHLMTRAGYDCDRLVAILHAFKARHPRLRLILEPGSAFTWRTGYLVSTVEDIVTNGGIRTAMLDVSFACHMPDCLEMPYKPAIVGAQLTDEPGAASDAHLAGQPATEPEAHRTDEPIAHAALAGQTSYRMGGNSCLAGDYMGAWIFTDENGDPRELTVGDRVVFEDMIHYTMVKTTMFNGVAHPAIVIVRRDGPVEVVREFGYEDFKNRMS